MPKSRKNKKSIRKIKPKKTQKQQEASEDYCFVCKDGGLLIVCDHKDCFKSYHPDCVGEDESRADAGEDHWICGWHSCFNCGKSSTFHCIGCPKAVCQSCIDEVEFAPIRERKGLCHECLKLALLVEEGVDVDSDGEKIDFKDRETYECLFMEYWEIINETQGITLEDLHSADARLKKGENCKSRSHNSLSDSDEYGMNEENLVDSSDSLDSDEAEGHDLVSRRNILIRHKEKKHKGSTKIEFFSWASKSLIEFLASIGIDTSEKLSQDNVASIIGKYVQDNKLFHPEKKKKVLCDARLRSVLGRRSVNIYKINDLLEGHFPENLEDSEEEEQEHILEDENANENLSSQKRKRSSMRSSQEKGSASEKLPQKEIACVDFDEEDPAFESCFASIIPKNMKLVYLKRSLVEELLKQPESFESKVLGSFVRVRTDAVNGRKSHQLLQVTGIKRTSTDETKVEVSLKLPEMPNDIPIHMLSNDDFSEEECEELHQKVKDGLIERPTVVELEKKARCLHQDVTKHWISSELAFLKTRIDLANEKGWRTKLYEYLERRELLQSQEEQSRLLQEVPKVFADMIKLKPASERPPQNGSPVNIGVEEHQPQGAYKILATNWEGSGSDPA
ncbi:hypothetical protein Ancab_000423 [Ancistrocladus abbreviatus]